MKFSSEKNKTSPLLTIVIEAVYTTTVDSICLELRSPGPNGHVVARHTRMRSDNNIGFGAPSRGEEVEALRHDYRGFDRIQKKKNAMERRRDVCARAGVT